MSKILFFNFNNPYAFVHACITLLHFNAFSSHFCTEQFLVNSKNPHHLEQNKKRNGIPEKTKLSEEAALRKQGYRPIFTDGLDEIKFQLGVGKRIRKEAIEGIFDPQGTHVPEFEKKVKDTLKSIENGIKQQGSDVQERLRILKDFRTEADNKLENQVTYRWWVRFNLRLSVLATPARNRISPDLWWKTETDIPDTRNVSIFTTEALNYFKNRDAYFPKVIFLPINYNLGLMALNKAAAGNMVPIALNNNLQSTDGRDQWPDEFSLHDYIHYASGYGKGNIRIHNHFEKKAPQLNREDREKVEIIYFMLEHEKNGHNITDYLEKRGSVKEYILGISYKFQDFEHYGVFLPNSVDLDSSKQVKRYLRSAVNTFFLMMRDFK